jgi:hypothetical protein
VKYTLAITDDTGHEHMKLEVEDVEEREADQYFYSMMLIRALDVSINLMPEVDREAWNSAFVRLVSELEAS